MWNSGQSEKERNAEIQNSCLEEVPPVLVGGARYKRETFNISLGCLTGLSVNIPKTELLICSALLKLVLL